MKIKWLGHASFLITSDANIRIITDPYSVTDEIRYDRIDETADIVTVSHTHYDHNNVAAVKGNPQVVRGTTEVKGTRFTSIPTYHDETRGSQRGSNNIFCFEVDGVKVCHLGDLGHPLSDRQASELGKIDVLLIPIGGFFTIDAAAATLVCNQLNPRVVIPMHYKNDKCRLPVKGVDDFLKGKTNVNRLDSSEVELKPDKLPASTQIIVLKPAK